MSRESAKPLWEEGFSNKIYQGWPRIIVDLPSTLLVGTRSPEVPFAFPFYDTTVSHKQVGKSG